MITLSPLQALCTADVMLHSSERLWKKQEIPPDKGLYIYAGCGHPHGRPLPYPTPHHAANKELDKIY